MRYKAKFGNQAAQKLLITKKASEEMAAKETIDPFKTLICPKDLKSAKFAPFRFSEDFEYWNTNSKNREIKTASAISMI